MNARPFISLKEVNPLFSFLPKSLQFSLLTIKWKKLLDTKELVTPSHAVSDGQSETARLVWTYNCR